MIFYSLKFNFLNLWISFSNFFLGIAFQKVSNNVQYFPTIGLHSPDEKVTVNFGNFPFEFNLNEYLEVNFLFSFFPMKF